MRAMFQVWPGLLVCSLTFASIQFFWSNFMGPSLVDILGGLGTLVVLAIFLKIWHPHTNWRYEGEAPPPAKTLGLGFGRVLLAWSPFLLLAAFVVLWGIPKVSASLDKVTWKQPVPGLHQLVKRVPPVVAKEKKEDAYFDVSWLSTAGTGTFIAGLIAGPLVGLSMRRTLQVFARSTWRLRTSLLAIMAMLGLGYLTRYCGMDATMGMAMSHTGALFPFFGTLIGWMGVALSGTDAGSNALFGSFQVITANKLGLSPILMGAANSAGGVMGKMIAAQTIVVATAATSQDGSEGTLFRFVFWHSVVLAAIVGLIVTAYAYVFPQLIPHGLSFVR